MDVPDRSSRPSRRMFLKGSLATAGVSIAATAVPRVFATAAAAAVNDGVHNDRVLVIVQLAGGNDGLNTVVPVSQGAYYQARPTIAVPADRALPLGDGLGLHPNLTGLAALYNAGNLAIVNGIGYPRPSYSHFEAMRIYQTADPTLTRNAPGWLSQVAASPSSTPLAACGIGDESIPVELQSDEAQVSVISMTGAYDFTARRTHPVAAAAAFRDTPGQYGGLFDDAVATAQASIASVKADNRSYRPAVPYRQSDGSSSALHQALRMTAELIVCEPTVKICHVTMGGFDTHTDVHTPGSTGRHDQLLSTLDSALSQFVEDLRSHGTSQRVAVMTWSEFGRRPAENSNRGTDHGSAAPMLVLGDLVRGGLHGDYPSLTSLDDGNLRYTVDFRAVYQNVIGDWMGGDPAVALGGQWGGLGLF